MDSIEITKVNLEEIKYHNIMFVSFAENTAKGDPGGIEILLKDMTLYHTNYSNNSEIEIKDLFKIFPPLETFQCANGTVTKLDPNWQWLDMGSGNYLIGRKTIIIQFLEVLYAEKLLGDEISPELIYQKWIEIAKKVLEENKKEGKIIFYDMNGNVKTEELITFEGLNHIIGMMARAYLKTDEIVEGYVDTKCSQDTPDYHGNTGREIYLWKWANLDEEKGELVGDGEAKYKQNYVRVAIKDIEKIEALMYSNPRWGGKLTNKFEFNSNQEEVKEKETVTEEAKKEEKQEKVEVQKIEKKQEIEEIQEVQEKYYFLAVKFEESEDGKTYNYIAEDSSIVKGDKVLVDRKGEQVVAEVVEVACYNKSDAQFLTNNTSRIICKIEEHKEEEEEIVEETQEEIAEVEEIIEEKEDDNLLFFDIEDTIFKFGVEKNTEDIFNQNFAKVTIKVKNENFKYDKVCEIERKSQLERIVDKFEQLTSDKLRERERLEFYKFELEFYLYPRTIKTNDKYIIYKKDENEIRETYVEMHINLKNKAGYYTGQRYTMQFTSDEIKQIAEYIKENIE